MSHCPICKQQHRITSFCLCIVGHTFINSARVAAPRPAMTSIVDSEAQFDLRLDQVKVPSALKLALRNSGITTISTLAYAHGQPGQPISNDEFAGWVRQLDPGATVGGVAALKRLLFESQTQLLALLKEQVTNPDPVTARRVPQAEREARLENLRNRLTGVLIEGHSEPCEGRYGLVDKTHPSCVRPGLNTRVQH